MYITLLKSKLHKGTVTEANINYRGSITIDKNLMEESGILPYELVQVVNVNNGERFETYVIEGEKNSGVICLNGAAARLVMPGDKVIIMAYAQMELEEAISFKPTILLLDENNKISEKC
jgi:aspartate 1-decarboxylase